ncbi:MAG: hypothetical protein KGH69_00325 [Candidatus Micrarchaeota archaeon]|nr:hypothetical protein [Candidatus Micrarchaeota archaeon]
MGIGMGVGAYQTLELASSGRIEVARAIRDLEEYAYSCKECRQDVREFLENYAKSDIGRSIGATEALDAVERIYAVEMLEVLSDNQGYEG